ncbi:MAG TPA: YkgJ family cysteine cluster protein [Burkholderiaceae bacterium]|nr:YkgJ family cysteine cluster protein [Burkholderiaceae bacterium]
MTAPTTIPIRSESLAEWASKAPPHEKEVVLHMHYHYREQLSAARFAIPLAQPAGIAAGINEVIDGAVERQLTSKQGRKVTCRRGCSACCHLHVTITEPEAKLALLEAADAGWQIDTERARLQAQAGSVEAWGELRDEQRACIFLTPAGLCAIYQHRPGACRKYMVVSPPAECDSIRRPGHKVAQLIAVEAEVMFNAALDVFPSGTLPAMVLAELEKESAQ